MAKAVGRAAVIKQFAFLRWIGGKISMNENPDVPNVIVIGGPYQKRQSEAALEFIPASGQPPMIIGGSATSLGSTNKLANDGCLASITFPYQRQLLFPIGDNYNLGKVTPCLYTGADRSRG